MRLKGGHGGRDERFETIAYGVAGMEDIEKLFAKRRGGGNVEGAFTFGVR